MSEITVFENGLEMGSFDVLSSDVFLGSVIMGDMKIVDITPKGEYSIVTIEFI